MLYLIMVAVSHPPDRGNRTGGGLALQHHRLPTAHHEPYLTHLNGVLLTPCLPALLPPSVKTNLLSPRDYST